MNHGAEVSFTEQPGNGGTIGIITLSRPKALNALSHSMIIALTNMLQKWQQQDNIKAVIICGDGERAFCAGGDIRTIYDIGKMQPMEALKFFWDEYRLNQLIFHYKKPYVAFIHGITMGGGLGISIHGSHCIACDNAIIAMPETGIGFIPDVGGSYFLSHCRNYIGFYLGLSGQRIDAASSYQIGLVKQVIPYSEITSAIQAIADASFGDQPDATIMSSLGRFGIETETSPIHSHIDTIEYCFSAKTVEEIIHRLRQRNTQFALQTVDILAKQSPTSLKLTLQLLQLGMALDLDPCLQMEYRIVNHLLQQPDFYEGIRAAVIDKDRNPHWQPNTLAAVTDAQIDHYFTALGERELHFEILH